MRRRFRPWGLPFLVALTLVPGSVGGGDVPPSSGRRIPFTLRTNKIILPVTVGDSRVLRIILDTGMPSSLQAGPRIERPRGA